MAGLHMNRPFKNKAPATALDPPTSSFWDNFRRDAVWQDNQLIFRRRTVATIIPDQKWPGMWRVQLPNGHITDMVSLTRAKDAAYANAVSQIEQGLHGSARPRASASVRNFGSRKIRSSKTIVKNKSSR
jgi:hypothetical protein